MDDAQRIKQAFVSVMTLTNGGPSKTFAECVRSVVEAIRSWHFRRCDVVRQPTRQVEARQTHRIGPVQVEAGKPRRFISACR
ncbi:hypothetical protein ACVBGC_31820 [Burkholderia stagnalis]